MTRQLSLFASVVVLSVVVSTLLAKPAEAHVLKTDGNIGAVLHIDPQDDPIAGEPANFFFEFKDRTGKFKPAECTCTFTISEADKQIFSQPLFASSTNPSLESSSVTFTFPYRAVYTVSVAGAPTTANAFQPFKLNYDIRVERVSDKTPIPSTSQTPTQSSHIWHYILAGIFVIVVAIFFVWQEIRRRKQPPIGPPSQPMQCLVGVAIAFFLIAHALPTHLLLVHDHNSTTDVSTEHPCCMPQLVNANAVPDVRPITRTAVVVSSLILQSYVSAATFVSANKSPPTVV